MTKLRSMATAAHLSLQHVHALAHGVRLTARGRMLSLVAMAGDQTDTPPRAASPDERPLPAQAPPSPSTQPLPSPTEQVAPVTGFEPRDRSAPAPDRLPSALDAFRGAPRMDPGAEVDPMAALSDKERDEHRQELADIVQAQRGAETLVGVTMRRV